MAEAMIPGHSQEGEPAGQTPPQKEEASDATTKPNANQQITDSPVKKVSHDERTVVIHIPSKRQKQSPDVKTRSVIEAISSSISPNERREALSSAILIFDHNMQSLHDEELELGADSVLVKHLGYLFSRKQTSGRKPSMERLIVNEMSVTCEALEMVLRASPSAVSQSFHRFGAEVLDLLIHLMDEETEKRRTDAPSHKSQSSDGETGDESSVKVEVPDNSEMSPSLGSVASSVCAGYCEEAGRHEADVLLRKASKTLGHFARVGAATKPMAYHPGLLPCLLKSLLMPIEVIPSETRLNSLWILANLACNADNMVMMACHPRLIASLVEMTCRPIKNEDSVEVIVEILRSKSIASRALLNLSWAPENRIPMSENVRLIQALATLTTLRKSPFGNRGRTVKGIIQQTRRHAVGALRNLAAAPPRNKIRLCLLQSGLLLNVLTDAALNDADSHVKLKAFETIRNLAIQDTAEIMIQNPALILALKDVLLSTEVENSEETPEKYASGTLLVLERSITPDMQCYQTLQDLLQSVNPSTDDLGDKEECAMSPTAV